MKRLLLSIGACFLFVGTSFGQSAGDIAFIAINADDDDDFAIVALNSLPDTTFYFSEQVWDGTNLTGTGWFTWNTGQVISQGTVVIFNDTDAGGSRSVSIGTLPSSSGTINLNVTGDAFWVYTTDSSTDTTFITAIATVSSEFDNIATTGLTEGTNAIDISGGSGSPDGGFYVGTRLSLNFSNFSSLVNDENNWTTTTGDGNDFLPYNSTAFATSSTISISGDAGWRMLSLPITGGDVEDISDDTAVQGIDGGSNTGETANFFINTASDGTGTDGWAEPTNVTTAWGDGLGFITFFYDNTTAGSSELPISLDVSGTEPGSDVDVTLSNTYTLVGNPFSSNIELDDITGNDSGQGVNDGLVSPISVWDDGAGTDGSGSWVTFNFGEGNEISSWQGFFLQRNSSSTTSLTIPVLAKTDTAADAAVFSKALSANWRRINLELETESFKDVSNKLYFSGISGIERDAFDGSKLNPFNNSPYVSFVKDFGNGNEYLSQDARAFDPTDIQEYRLDFNDMGVSGEYTLSWPEWKNIPSGWAFTLKDELTGTEVDMRETDGYTFTVQSKQKRPVSTMLSAPEIKAKSSGGNPRFSITLVAGTSVSNEERSQPKRFALEQNYPNPFNPSTTIKYSLEETGLVSLSVYNIVGQKVGELVNEVKTAGSHNISWNASDMSSGIYYYRLVSGSQVLTRKMTLIK
ncbi:MAG: T9SS type A sorting domain-containing protein [Balneolaceae bacterium]|nr:T9SS type A sorting domain-containing protein [Balneolaceae bacterium]MBO6547044.1 T9SS type A sorting domain-containing protein [Balneolaceae bacterium]MBO6648009.1 T9SS type A sorting domain-containing protein [Balneolaceae bacterium]